MRPGSRPRPTGRSAGTPAFAGHRALVEAVSADIARACAAARLREPEGDWHWPNASFLLVEVGEQAVDVCWLGDCRLILSLNGRVVTAGEAGDGEARERESARALAAAAGHAAHRREGAVLDDLRRRRATLVAPGGPRVLGVAPDTAERLSTARFPRQGPVTGLVMSDGLSALELKYARRTAAGMLAGAESEGLARLAVEVRSIEEREDPDGERYPRFKRSDDATGLLFRA